MASEKFYQVGVKALITNDKNEILPLKSVPGFHEPHWDLPGGRIQEGQTAIDALKREIEEETDITDVTDVEFFQGCISNHELTFENMLPVGLVLMIYRVRIPTDSSIKLSEEHTEYEWVTMAEVASRLEAKYPMEFTQLLRQT
jgi:8-oxo-dGTP pyrophosphatase MutT (NUDIX family)